MTHLITITRITDRIDDRGSRDHGPHNNKRGFVSKLKSKSSIARIRDSKIILKKKRNMERRTNWKLGGNKRVV